DFPILASAATMFITNDNSLASISAPVMFFCSGGFQLYNLPSLQQLDFSYLTSIAQGLTIDTVPRLTSLSAFSKVTLIGGGFTMQHANALRDFTGLDAVHAITGD